MKFSGFLAAAALAAVANAHSTIWNIYVNDVDQGVGNVAGGYIRFPPNNSPVKDIDSKAMTCNVNNAAAAKTVAAAAGDKITVEWHHDTNSASDDIIDGSHKGPVMVYIAPTASNGAGDVWVKLAEDGFSGGKWAVDTLKANGGKHSFTLPSVLAAGDYLIRPEIIALHESDAAFNVNPARGAQFYMECIQLKVSGSGSTTLPAGVAIPGAYKYSDPGVVFNLYGSFTTYTIPGPAVWDAASGGSPAPAPAPATSAAAPVVTPTPSAAPPSAPASTEAPAPAPVTTNAPAATTAEDSPCRPQSTFATVVVPAPSGVSGAIALYGQCGGINYSGATACAAGTCKVQNPYYSQCI